MTNEPEDPGIPDRTLVPSWLRSGRTVPRLVLRPLQTFLETEYAGGLLLLAAAVAALAWANSPVGDSYERVWHTELTLGPAGWQLSHDFRGWVNEGLMAMFFFVVGLEIKRELVSGELRDPRAASLPVIAALGGMVVPALIYLAFNPSGIESRGWGIPVATDIAFAVGVLALVAPGIPTSLKAFLLALAIVDDIGAIVVIAIFYSGVIDWAPLVLAAALVAGIGVLQRLRVTYGIVFTVMGIAAWLATSASGIHPTIVGVALGLVTRATPFQRPAAVSVEAHRIADETADEPDPVDADAPLWLRLGQLSRQAVSPLARMESLLHPWTSFVVIPMFALANAGIVLSRSTLTEAATSPVTLGVVAGLVVGKPLGIALASWLGVRAGLARLPSDVRRSQLVGVGALAGIGFTVSIFIADLAFTGSSVREAATIGVLAASVLAGAVGAAVFAVTRRFGAPSPGATPRPG
jgi:NhaA family Na+:H+ antiporter